MDFICVKFEFEKYLNSNSKPNLLLNFITKTKSGGGPFSFSLSL
jgi:hypothetical protein